MITVSPKLLIVKKYIYLVAKQLNMMRINLVRCSLERGYIINKNIQGLINIFLLNVIGIANRSHLRYYKSYFL